MKFERYRALRGRLHHDWLLNRFLVFLSARMGQLDGRTSLPEDIRSRLAEWREKKDDFLALARGVEEALSPRQLLDEVPLVALPQEHKAWLGPVIHELYCERTGIRLKAAALEAIIIKGDGLVEVILKDDASADAGAKLYEACVALSNAISELPTRIQIA